MLQHLLHVTPKKCNENKNTYGEGLFNVQRDKSATCTF